MDSLKKYNILLVDDEREFAATLTQTLKFYFAHVYFAPAVKEALEIIKHQHIDLIMSDIHLKNENGLEFIEQLQKHIPVIMISGFDDKAFLMRSIKLSVIDYLLKPFDLNALEKALQRFVDSLPPQEKNIYKIRAEVYFDVAKKVIIEKSEEVMLTAKEYLFLQLLFTNKETLVTREVIEEVVYHDEVMSKAALKNLLFRLRKKLGKDFIVTVPELGYRINQREVERE